MLLARDGVFLQSGTHKNITFVRTIARICAILFFSEQCLQLTCFFFGSPKEAKRKPIGNLYEAYGKPI